MYLYLISPKENILPNYKTISQQDFLDSRDSYDVPEPRRKKLQGVGRYSPLEGSSLVRTWRVRSCIRDPWLQTTGVGTDSRCTPSQIPDLRQNTLGFPGCNAVPYLDPGASGDWVSSRITDQALESHSSGLKSPFLTYYLVDLGQWPLRASVFHNIQHSPSVSHSSRNIIQ